MNQIPDPNKFLLSVFLLRDEEDQIILRIV